MTLALYIADRVALIPGWIFLPMLGALVAWPMARRFERRIWRKRLKLD